MSYGSLGRDLEGLRVTGSIKGPVEGDGNLSDKVSTQPQNQSH
jgi:hypothetical protein